MINGIFNQFNDELRTWINQITDIFRTEVATYKSLKEENVCIDLLFSPSRQPEVLLLFFSLIYFFME